MLGNHQGQDGGNRAERANPGGEKQGEECRHDLGHAHSIPLHAAVIAQVERRRRWWRSQQRHARFLGKESGDLSPYRYVYGTEGARRKRMLQAQGWPSLGWHRRRLHSSGATVFTTSAVS